MMNKKSLIIISIVVIAILCILGVVCLLNNEKSYDIRITIPVGSTETYVYSDEEISPIKSQITISSGDGLGYKIGLDINATTGEITYGQMTMLGQTIVKRMLTKLQ